MSDDRVFAKCAWRLIPLIAVLYLANYVDRVNAGFAALTMNKDLGFTPTVFGFGAGILFLSYALFQVPANVTLARFGARRFVFCIMVLWSIFSAATAFVRTSSEFYILRFLLGAAESGFFPGMIFYLSLWFPAAYRGRFAAGFMLAIPASLLLGGPLSVALLDLEGLANLHGWQWLFLIEGAPVLLLAVVVLFLLPDGPSGAEFLSADEKALIAVRLASEESTKPAELTAGLRDPRVFLLGLVLFSVLGVGYGVTLWLPQIVQSLEFSNRATGFIVALPAVLAAPLMVLWGRSSDRSGERAWHLVIAMLFTATGFAVASVAQSGLVGLIAISAAWIGQLSCLPIVHNLPGSFLRGPAAAAGLGVFNMVGQLGGFAGPYIIGAAKEYTGTYASAMMFFSLSLVLCALIVLAVGRSIVVPVQASRAA
jgi:ACS family tartrate transporter-like MFS transporter